MGGISIAKRTTVTATGEVLRECSLCKARKPPTDFSHAGEEPRGICKECTNARARRYREEGRLSIKPIEHRREIARRSAKRNRDKRLQQHREYLARMKADPIRHARYLEGRRIAYRLQREREGFPLDSIRPMRDVRFAPVADGYVPSKPLAALIKNTLTSRRSLAKFTGDTVSIEAVCAEVGISSRNYRRWESGEQPTARVQTAEELLGRMELEWADAYSPEDYPEIYAMLDSTTGAW